MQKAEGSRQKAASSLLSALCLLSFICRPSGARWMIGDLFPGVSLRSTLGYSLSPLRGSLIQLYQLLIAAPSVTELDNRAVKCHT